MLGWENFLSRCNDRFVKLNYIKNKTKSNISTDDNVHNLFSNCIKLPNLKMSRFLHNDVAVFWKNISIGVFFFGFASLTFKFNEITLDNIKSTSSLLERVSIAS